jgi:hypothetical protein
MAPDRIQWRAVSPRVKQSGREAHHSHAPNDDVKNDEVISF